jgi:hypothetical protein
MVQMIRIAAFLALGFVVTSACSSGNGPGADGGPETSDAERGDVVDARDGRDVPGADGEDEGNVEGDDAWVVFDAGGVCLGTASDCSAFATLSACTHQIGCRWLGGELICVGTATACADFHYEDRCVVQAGCRWDAR